MCVRYIDKDRIRKIELERLLERKRVNSSSGEIIKLIFESKRAEQREQIRLF